MGKIRHHIEESDHEKILSLWNEGYGPSAIGLKLALSHSKIKRWLEARGLKRSQREGLREHIRATGSFRSQQQSNTE